jgi:Tfp pilus assembly protein PilP
MNLTTGILAVAIMTGAAWAQNPDAIDNARSIAKSLQQKQTNDTNAALAAAGTPAVKPGAATPALKPASTQAAKGNPAPMTAAVKPHVAPGPKKSAASHAVIAAKEPVSARSKAAPNADDAKSTDATKPPKPEDKKWAMSGKRDPFFSPVVQQSSGSGCSTGKKCLEIGQINVRGVVKSESGFIAVVTNSLNKAYFLHENDPVFNGYVVRITGDSVVFQETVQDKLGKPLTREVVKRIYTPAV